MKFLIDNCVPVNNGDAALIFGLGDRLANYGEVIYHTFYYSKVIGIYPERKWKRHLLDNPSLKLIKKIPLVNRLVIACKLLVCRNVYKDVDTIISAPGGYLNSNYFFFDKLFILYLCKHFLKKKVGIYSQSIGPLSKKDQQLLIKYGKTLDFIYVRDQVSYERLRSLYPFENLTLTKDAAFLLTPHCDQRSATKQVAISVREWHFDGRKEAEYFKLLKSMVDQALLEGNQVVFLSTCQGMADYVDDSKLAKRFVATYYSDCQKVTVDDQFYSLVELRKRLQAFDFVFATRLHMCILSLLSGTLAFNISYEEKGRECYRYLGLSQFTVDYNEQTTIEKQLVGFFQVTDNEKKAVFKKVKTIHQQQFGFLDQVTRDDS